MYERGIKAAQAAGQKPEEALYRRAVQAAYDAKIASVNDLARQWVVAYPSPDSWRNSLAIFRNQANLAVGVAECNEVLTKQTDAKWRPVLFRELGLEQDGMPVFTEHLAHWGIRPDPAQQLVV